MSVESFLEASVLWIAAGVNRPSQPAFNLALVVSVKLTADLLSVALIQ